MCAIFSGTSIYNPQGHHHIHTFVIYHTFFLGLWTFRTKKRMDTGTFTDCNTDSWLLGSEFIGICGNKAL